MFSSLETSPPATQLNSSSAPKTFNMENLDTETEHEEESEDGGVTKKESQEIIMRHSLPKAVSRKNVQLPGYVPEGTLFGAFTTRGEGITQATYRYPEVVQAIHHLASLRGGEASCEGYLSAQVNRAKRMQVHKDKKNHRHVQKSNLCQGCLLSEGPRKLHKRVRDVDKATPVLHIDIAGPYIESHEGHHYFLVGALRLPDRTIVNRCETAKDKNIS